MHHELQLALEAHVGVVRGMAYVRAEGLRKR